MAFEDAFKFRTLLNAVINLFEIIHDFLANFDQLVNFRVHMDSLLHCVLFEPHELLHDLKHHVLVLLHRV